MTNATVGFFASFSVDMKFTLEGGLQNGGKIDVGLFGFIAQPAWKRAIFFNGSHFVFAAIVGEVNVNQCYKFALAK